MVLSFKCTKNLIERIKAQNQRGYKIDRKTPRRKHVLPVNDKPVLPVSEKQPPQENKTVTILDPTDQKEVKQEKKIEQKKLTSKMTKNDSNATSKSKTNKDVGRKESTQHKCILSYTEQDWPAGATK